MGTWYFFNYIRGYKLFGKLREGIQDKRRECRVGFLVSELLMHDRTIIKDDICNEIIEI